MVVRSKPTPGVPTKPVSEAPDHAPSSSSRSDYASLPREVLLAWVQFLKSDICHCFPAFLFFRFFKYLEDDMVYSHGDHEKIKKVQYGIVKGRAVEK